MNVQRKSARLASERIHLTRKPSGRLARKSPFVKVVIKRPKTVINYIPTIDTKTNSPNFSRPKYAHRVARTWSHERFDPGGARLVHGKHKYSTPSLLMNYPPRRNIHLHPDGTERSAGDNNLDLKAAAAHDDELRSPSPPVTPVKTKTKSSVKIENSRLRRYDLPINKEVAEAIRIPDLQIRRLMLAHDHGSPIAHLFGPFIEAFEHSCQSSALTGLASLSHAAQVLLSRYPGTSAKMELSSWLRTGLDQSTSRKEYLHIILDGRLGSAKVRILISPMNEVKMSFAPMQFARSPTQKTIRQVLVTLYLRQSSRLKWSSSPSDASDVSLVDDIASLSEKSNTVLRKLCEELTFPNTESASHLVAEALLRTINPLNPRLELDQADVTISPFVEDNMPEAMAKAATKDAVLMDSEGPWSIQSEGTTMQVSSDHGGTETGSSIAQEDKRDDGAQSRKPSDVDPRIVSSDHSTASSDQPTGRLEAEQRQSTGSAEPSVSSTEEGKVYIALGSNMGDRLDNIEKACNLIDADPDMKILGTSGLYETDPMYVQDQDPFLNGACEISTTLQPLQLLDRLQAIETKLGRVKVVEKGPRTIDLDILMYRGQSLESERLTIPHPLMHERDFVIRPMASLPSARHMLVPGTSQSFDSLSARFRGSAHAASSLHPLTQKLSLLRKEATTDRTLIMSILNTTPDSFSDGGSNDATNRLSLYQTVKSHVLGGASIIDVGGQSSRPNAPDVTADEEIARILPAIEAIKACPEAADVAISVDTYRAVVAEAAVKAGAHIVNDISAGQLDPDMLPTVARLGCTYVMMHMRGSPATMQSEKNCTYPKGVAGTVIKELGWRVQAAHAAGIRGWRIILDPGIGFSKTQEQNLTLLRSLKYLRSPTHPLLVGSSRKSFIGSITGVAEPRNRGWGTAATVTAAVQGGTDIVRVHDVEEMAAVVKMANAIFRTN